MFLVSATNSLTFLKKKTKKPKKPHRNKPKRILKQLFQHFWNGLLFFPFRLFGKITLCFWMTTARLYHGQQTKNCPDIPKIIAPLTNIAKQNTYSNCPVWEGESAPFLPPPFMFSPPFFPTLWYARGLILYSSPFRWTPEKQKVRKHRRKILTVQPSLFLLLFLNYFLV